MTRYPVKITVLKRVDPSVIFDGNVPNSPDGEKYHVCTAFQDKQEFVVPKNTNSCPANFCHWAWNDIFKDFLTVKCGGSFYPWVEDGIAIACCSDGIRPVSFKIERMEE